MLHRYQCYVGEHMDRFSILLGTLLLFLPWACKLSIVEVCQAPLLSCLTRLS